MAAILIRYGEIALKGAKRDIFTQQLKNNIQRSLNLHADDIQVFKAQFMVNLPDGRVEEAVEVLGRVCGIVWYAPVLTCASNMEEMKQVAQEFARGIVSSNQSFAIDGSRSEKSLPFTSRDIAIEVGAVVQQATGANVDLTAPNVIISVIASKEGAYIFSKRYPGVGGLPVGTSGKVLSLISGGFDSIAASFLLAKRGAEVDFLHFHVFPGKEQVIDSKIMAITESLSRSTYSRNLFLSSYLPFEMKVLDLDRWSRRFETVIFRRLMARVGMRVGEKIGASALIFGDSLGQVASQTMENLVAVDHAVEMPIFRPLIGMDKVEIIEIVRQVGLYEQAAAKYKDCCSILSPQPVKKAYLPVVMEVEEKIGVDEIIKEMAEAVEIVALGD